MIASVGRATIGFFTEFGGAATLFGQAVAIVGVNLVAPFRRGRGTGRGYAWTLLLEQMVAIGVRSLPVTLLTLASTGMVFALEIGEVMIDKLGAPINLGRIVGVAITTELGPVLAGVMIAARCGSAIAAEIGSMKVTEQVDALSCLGTSPVSQLVSPRLLAAVLCVPLLTVFADVTGVFGGYVVAVTQLGVSPDTFLGEVRESVWISDIAKGLFKTLFFGAILATAACYTALRTEGGAEGVGKSCIRAVVWSTMGILIADYLLSSVIA